jgi:hypothetical protein
VALQLLEQFTGFGVPQPTDVVGATREELGALWVEDDF